MAHRFTIRKLGVAWIAVLTALALSGSTFLQAYASPATYFVSLTGSDTNPGTQTAPFKTFAKATSVLMPGDTLYILAGVYNAQIKMSRSGASGSPITIQPVPGAAVVIDLLNAAPDNVLVTGSYVVVKGLELRNSSGYCVNLRGTHNTVQGMRVHDCHDMGINTDGQYETIVGNIVYHASTINSTFSLASAWGSGIKVRCGANNVLVANNRIYNNFGEGIAVTRASGITVRQNISHDNYKANIYVDNSYNVTVDRNFTFSQGTGFGPTGVPSDNIAIGEESYAGWGAQLSNIRVTNNIAFHGKHGVTFYGNYSGTPGGGLKNSTIAFNTLWGSVQSELSVTYDTGQAGNLIANNIIQQPGGNLVWMTNASGITFSHNFWVGKLPPIFARGPGDKAGNVMLAGVPGYSAAAFELSSASPALNSALMLSGVLKDYSGDNRPAGSAADMGAYEFGATP